MKTIQSFLFYLMGIITLFSVILASCKKETESDPKIIMVTESISSSFFARGSGSMSIDWGDKTKIETHTLSTDYIVSYSHSYKEFSEHIVTITGKNITYFGISNYSGVTSLDLSSNEMLTYLECNLTSDLTSLDVSKNWLLKKLIFHGTQITSLDLSNNTVLEFLDCRSNNLSTEALNALFETLHDYSYPIFIYPKEILIDDNPGTDDCDRSIATNKGWEFIE